MNLADEMFDHFLRHFEIGDHPIAHRADSLDIPWRAPEHHLGIVPDSADLLLSPFCKGRNDRWLVQDDATAPHIDQRIGRSQIDGHVTGEYAE